MPIKTVVVPITGIGGGNDMKQILFGSGVTCMIAGIVEGDLTAGGFKFPVVKSPKRQWMLVLLGAVLIMASFLGP